MIKFNYFFARPQRKVLLEGNGGGPEGGPQDLPHLPPPEGHPAAPPPPS